MSANDPSHAALLAVLEQHIERRQAGCPLLLAVELASAIIALESTGVSGEIVVGGVVVEVGVPER